MLLLLLAAAMPTQAMQTAIKSAVGRDLKDPYSAQYEWQPVKSETLYCGWVNAKNSYGAYEGYRPFSVIYAIGKSGRVMTFSVSTDARIVGPQCLDSGYTVSR